MLKLDGWYSLVVAVVVVAAEEEEGIVRCWLIFVEVIAKFRGKSV